MSNDNPLGVPAHRHRNPDGTEGGWVADTATVAAKAHIGRYARVQGGTIWGGTIEGGTIRGGTIWGGTIEGGTIWGGTIRGGTIEGDRDVLTVGPVGSEDQHATLVRDPDSDAGHILTIGCWRDGTVDALAAEVQKRCPGRADEYAEIEAVLRRRLAEWAAETTETTKGKNR